MILIDVNTGSEQLIRIFPKEITKPGKRLPADIILTGPDGSLGVEFKRLGDVLKCICDGRFAGYQLPTMIEEGLDPIWLIVEDKIRIGSEGELQVLGKGDRYYDARVGNRRFAWSDYKKWLLTMQINGGINVYESQSRLETKRFVMAMHEWWEKGKDGHKSHQVTNRSRDKATILKPSLLREIAEKLPGIGHSKAKLVEANFGNVGAMMVADVDDWCAIDGIGRKMAERIIGALYGTGEEV